MMLDTIADMLTRIRNASAVKKTEVLVPYSKINFSIARILEKEKYVGKLDLSYILYRLSLNLKDSATGEGNKRVTVKIIEKVPIEIIINKMNTFDITKQKKVANKFLEIEKIKSQIKEKFLEITSQTIDIN